jgi:hypothetical protein
LFYINDLPKITNNKSKIVLFADNTNIIISNPNPLASINEINEALRGINNWFNANLLSLNADKNYFMRFSTKNSSVNNLNITYDNNVTCNISNTKFLGIKYISHSHGSHINMTDLKLSAVCFAIRMVKLVLSVETLKMLYYAYFHSIMNYGIILGGNSSCADSI